MEKEKFERNCPQCNENIYYTNKKNRNNSERKKKLCRKCVNNRFFEENEIKMKEVYLHKFDADTNDKIIILFQKNGARWEKFVKSIQPLIKEFYKNKKEQKYYRNCPECVEEISYVAKFDRDEAEKEKRLCKSCGSKGDKNSFYGKTHSQETINKIQNSHQTSESWANFQERQQTDELRKKISEKLSGENNPAFGRGTLKDIWIKKLGEEEGNKRNDEWLKLQSKNSSGENNPMFGKPSPNGSGNGWSGWYKNWFFRSLRELSYMINVIEKEELKWETGESQKYKIEYIDYTGETRNYFPDFVIEGKRIIECKPQKLHNSPAVLAKKLAAEKFCELNNFTYELIDIDKISFEELQKLHDEKIITFTEKYEEKFQNYTFKESNIKRS